MPQLDLFAPVSQKETVETKQPFKGVDGNGEGSLVQDNVQQVPVEAITKEVLTQQKPLSVLPLQNNETIPPQALQINDVVFSDEKISVKIKQKKILEPVAEIFASSKPVKLPQKRGRKSLKETPGEVELIEVPDDEELFKKQYYPISMVAKWFNVNTSLLRFWENEFDILKPRKNRKGDRLFRPEDVKNLQLIHHLLRHRKYSIEGAKEYLKGNKDKADVQLKLTISLQKFRSFLLELKANLQA